LAKEELFITKEAQTMCLEKTNFIGIRWVFQISVGYKSNSEKKIIPIFSKRERERERES
jgi:hypothetical protein